MLRDCGVRAYIIAGVALEVGIEPTVRHSADLGYVPVVVRDACGGGDKRLWVAASFVNYVGPIAYFTYGRKR